MAPEARKTRRKQVTLDAALAAALESLSRDEGLSFDLIADEAFRDVLKKKGRPISLRDALRASARTLPANDPVPHDGPKTDAKRSARKP